jgi:Fur family transcriptional regulator, ferric uptake regulator
MTAAHNRPHHEHDHDDVDVRVDAILDRLRAEGGRITTGRRAIVRALFDVGDHHVTADHVAATVQAEHPDVHLSTVYRTLDALEELGVVGRVALGQHSAVYHLVDHVHHHLLCERCGSVTEIPTDALAGLSEQLVDEFDFRVSPSTLVIRGVCRACR